MQISTSEKRQIIDITEQVSAGGRTDMNGICNVFVQHTTAAVTIMDLDPGTDIDFLDFLNSLVPNISWRHPHDPSHAPDHLLASLVGNSVSIPLKNGELALGTWQRIVLVEFDGPRERNLEVATVASK